MSRKEKASSKDESSETPKSDKGIADIVKKIVSVGIGGAFMTEEAVKSVLGDIPLPKDILSGLMQNAKQAKEDFLETLRDEVKEQFTKIDPSKLVDELVERYDIEVTATFKFKKKNQNLPEKK